MSRLVLHNISLLQTSANCITAVWDITACSKRALQDHGALQNSLQDQGALLQTGAVGLSLSFSLKIPLETVFTKLQHTVSLQILLQLANEKYL